MDDVPVPSLRLRRAALITGLAFALLFAAVLLPWWEVTNRTANTATSERFGLWTGGGGLAHPAAAWTTAALAFLPLPLLFIRLAGRSWVHEPASWRRDVGLAMLLALAALVSCWVWPLEGPFWGTQNFVLDTDGSQLQVGGHPAMAWWVELAAVALLAWAWAWSRPAK